jgi:hypothetical protein
MSHAGPAQDWSTFSLADLTTPATMLDSLPASEDDVVLVLEPESDWVSGHGSRRRDRKHPFTATIRRAIRYGEADTWRLYLTFPEIATKRSFVLPPGARVTQVGRTTAEIAVPAKVPPIEMVEFTIDAVCRLAGRPDAGVWRARIPSYGGRAGHVRR